MISVICWKWGALFGPEYVLKLRSMLARHLHAAHRLTCVTDDVAGLDGVSTVALPHELSEAPRCLRRLRQYDPRWLDDNELWGERVVSIDLDVVIVDDVTSLFTRPEPIALWYVRHSSLFCTSIVMYAPDALRGLWGDFIADPAGYAAASMADVYPARRLRYSPQPDAKRAWFDASDQPIVNHYVRTHRDELDIGVWSEEEHGVIPYFGAGYRRGYAPIDALPAGARIVALGSSDKHVMDAGGHRWIKEHWH